MKLLVKLFLAAIIVVALLQLARPSIPAKLPTADLAAPPEVKRILEQDCYSCHSDQRRLAWFDQIVPAYWLVRHDILTARQHLNFSTLGSKPAAMQRATLFEAVNMIQLGTMPLPSFRKLHPEANITPKELATLKAYLAPWSQPSAPPQPSAPQSIPSLKPISLASVQPEPNGFAFNPAFESWHLLSTTDRGDNNTFRFILGNDIAIQAAQAGNISPWPDGSTFAKIAWKQQPGPDGLIHPGKFLQVELMLKNAATYKQTEGWGWGRWLGDELKPYGTNAQFVTQCTTCHLPVKGDDYVYTLPISTAKAASAESINNAAAALPTTLPYQPLNWTPITLYTDPKTLTTATLYGNPIASKATHSRATSTTPPNYPAGAVLALVTWAQRDDPHWFGGRIPNQPVSVEFVEITPSDQLAKYRHFAGPTFTDQPIPASQSTPRTTFILGLPPAPLP